MNILPTGPDVADFDPHYQRYFADLKRWNFDIAYNAHYAFSLERTLGQFAESYRRFVAGAKEAGVPCCVQIQSTVANALDVPFTETQRYVDNQYYCYEHFEGEGKVNHFGSFGSRVWLEHQKKLARIFRDFGFEWVVFEEPMLISDIPGTQDPICAIFKQRHPDLEYPTHQAESPAYLVLQALKRDVLVEFYSTLADYAKEIGFKKVGLMPWFFTPTFENTPPETWATSCDTGRVTFIDAMDFIIVRMQPDNIHAQAMIAATGESTPTLAYYECMAHNLGKPIIMVNNPTDEHRPEWHGASTLLPINFFTKYTLAAVAALPQGMSRHWYGKDYDADSSHMDLMTRTNDLLRRLGPAVAEIAFVFSFSGASHVWPRPWREVWRTYWAFAQQVTEHGHSPFLTFFAGTLAQSLALNPEVKILVLNEFFPIPPAEVAFVESWLAGDARRGVVYLAGHDGYRWSTAELHVHYRLLPPEMASLMGVDTTRPVTIVYPDPESELRSVTNVDAVFGEKLRVRCASMCSPQFQEGVGVEVLYRSSEENAGVIARRRLPSGAQAWFVGLGIEGAGFNFPLAESFRTLLGSYSSAIPFRVKRSTQSVYFNYSRTGYVVIANCAAGEGTVEFHASFRCWDVDCEMLVKLRRIQMAPLSVKLYRVVLETTSIYDVRNAIMIESIHESLDHAVITGMFHSKITLLLKTRPKQILLDGAPAHTTKPFRIGRAWALDILDLKQADMQITLEF